MTFDKRRQNSGYRVLLTVLFLSFLVLSCSRESVVERAREKLEQGKYSDAIFVVKHYLRKGGEKVPELLYIEGVAYLKMGQETHAFDAFAECYSMDSTWAAKIAEDLKSEAISSLEAGLTTKAKRMIAQAITYSPGIDFGRYDAFAGELLLDRNNFSLAARYLERYLTSFSDSAGSAKVSIDLGSAYEGLHDTTAAIRVYREVLDKYPKSTYKSMARWKLENLLYTGAENCFKGAEFEKAAKILMEIVHSTANPLMKEKAYYLLGADYERMGRTDDALKCYREVVGLNLGSSSRLMDKAKERIEKLETSNF